MVLGIGRFWYADDNDACLYSAASAVNASVRVPPLRAPPLRTGTIHPTVIGSLQGWRAMT